MNIRKYGVEIRKLRNDDLSLTPQTYDNDIDQHAELQRITAGGMLFPEDDTVPHFWLRMFETDKVRWGGIIRCGEGPLAPHTSAHHKDIAQAEAIVTPYKKIKDNPETWQISSEKIHSCFTWTEDGAHWQEGENGEIVDVNVTYFPFAIFMHLDSPFCSTYFSQFVILDGTYQGKTIRAMGQFDRPCVPKVTGEMGLNVPSLPGKHDPLCYVNGWYSGIRKDGRKELAYTVISEKNGEGVGVYWLEGEEPILSNEVTLEADWQKLPYTDETDPTVSYTKAVWKFGGKTIHFIGKWGGKAHLEKPRLDRPGLSQVYGTWYEGEEPYEHDLWFTYNEASHCPREVIEEMGFKVL